MMNKKTDRLLRDHFGLINKANQMFWNIFLLVFVPYIVNMNLWETVMGVSVTNQSMNSGS